MAIGISYSFFTEGQIWDTESGNKRITSGSNSNKFVSYSISHSGSNYVTTITARISGDYMISSSNSSTPTIVTKNAGDTLISSSGGPFWCSYVGE